jgi:hypothetical protein
MNIGSGQLYKDASGNLGIGTSSPSYKLDVSGTARITGITRTPALYGTTTGITGFMDSLGTTGMYVTGAGASPSNSIRFFSAGTTTATLDSSGNLGLGVTPSAWGSPIKNLDINTTGGFGSYSNGTGSQQVWQTNNAYLNSSLAWVYKYTGVGAFMYNQDSGHKWLTAPSGTAGNAIPFTQAMTLDASGNLGIGTSSPSYKLDVSGTARITGNLGLGVTPSAWGSTYRALDVRTAAIYDIPGTISGLSFNAMFNGTNWVYKGTGGDATALRYQQGFGQHQWFTAPSGTAGDAISFTQAMTLDASGNLLVGTTSSNPSGATGGSAFLALSDDRRLLRLTTSTASARDLAQFFNSNGQVGSISTSGSATTYSTSSDYRLKTVLGSVSGSGERIDSLEPVEYEWKSNGSRTRGFLAHKFQEVYPSSVTGDKDAVDAEGNPVYQTMQASTSEVIADLVAEIQSLRKRITTLEAK